MIVKTDNVNYYKEGKNSAKYLNRFTYETIYQQLSRIARNIYKWNGLPKETGLRSEFIERALYYRGQAVFAYDKNIGHICLPCSPDMGYNVYGYPTALRAFGYNNAYNPKFKTSECVWIRNNIQIEPTDNIVMFYAQKIASTMRIADINLNAQRTPYIIKCGNNNKYSFKQIYNDVEEGKPAIFIDSSVSLDDIVVLPTNAPYITDKIMDYRNTLLNEFLSMIGINNSQTDKKERLLTDEINSNNEFIDANLQTFYNMRKEACEEINEMFNLNISVEMRINKEQPQQEKEVNDNEQLPE